MSTPSPLGPELPRWRRQAQLYGIYAYLASGGLVLGGAALAAALLGDRGGRIWWPLSRVGSAGMLKMCGVTELITEGFERLPRDSGAVVMPNHESLFDPAVLMRPSLEPLRFVIKKQVEYYPIFGQALWAMGHIFVDRGHSEQAHHDMERAARAVGHGRLVLIFPEGTRTRDGELGPFKKGGFVLAQAAQVPIFPVGIAGARSIMPRGKGWWRPGPVAVGVGEPVAPPGPGRDALEAKIAEARERVSAARERARQLTRAAAER